MAASSSSLSMEPSDGGQAPACEMTSFIDGLGQVWDADPEIRSLLRGGGQLFKPLSERNMDIKTPSKLHFVMKPLLEKMAENDKKVPGIDALREEVKLVYKLNHREVTSFDIDTASWNLRKYAGFVKMKCRKGLVSTDTCILSIVLVVSLF